MAERAWCTDEADGHDRPAPTLGPARPRTPSAARRRSRRTAHTASFSAMSAALTRSSSAPASSASASRRGLDLHGLAVEAVDQVGDGGGQARGLEQRA